ncbi:MAG: hypothetical protein GY754_22065 [bacterium]|nr:hypothetical protein [bacterium]
MTSTLNHPVPPGRVSSKTVVGFAKKNVFTIKKKVFLQFEYVNWKKTPAPDWEPLPASFTVELLAGTTEDGARVLETKQSNAAGKCDFQFDMPKGGNDLYFFRVKGNSTAPGKMIPKSWSTFRHRTIDAKPGRVARTGFFGTSANPLKFKIGFFCSMQLKYKDKANVEHTVLEGTEVDFRIEPSSGANKRWMKVFHFNSTSGELHQNNFKFTSHGSLEAADDIINFSQSSSKDHFRKALDAKKKSELIEEKDYSKYCALVGKEGCLRFISFDPEEGTEGETSQKIHLTIYARAHDLKYKTEPVEFCKGGIGGIGEIAINVIIPYFNIDVDDRIFYTFEYARDVSTAGDAIYQLKKTSPVLIPQSEEYLRSSLYHSRVTRLQNQVLKRLTGGEYKGIPGQVVKVSAKIVKAQRPFCPPGLGAQLITDNVWDSDMQYTVVHERGHGIMWDELGISFRRVAWEFAMPRCIGGDYINDHGPTKETNVETALYDGWADFCSMFTDWNDRTNMRCADMATSGSVKGFRPYGSTGYNPFNIKLLDSKKTTRFPPSESTIDNHPDWANFGERIEGVIANLLWKIWTQVCGGGSIYGNKIDGSSASGAAPSLPATPYFNDLKDRTKEHIEENVYTDDMCQKFQKYIWNPFKHFWYDRKGNCNLHDYWDPSIRDFINAQVALNGSSDAGVKQIMDLAHERLIARPELVSYLQLECWNSSNRTWVPLPNDIEVEAWDWDPVSPNDLQGRGKTVGGTGQVIIKTKYKDEDNPEIFFKVKAKGKTLPDGRKVSRNWSTEDMKVWRVSGGASSVTETKYKGYYNDYRKYYIGKPGKYEIFRFNNNLEVHVKFEVWNPGTKSYDPFPSGLTVKVIDYDPGSPNDVLAAGKLDANGKCSIPIDDKDETNPDIFFEVHTDGRTVNGYKMPRVISTKDMKDHNDKRGYYPNFKDDEIGTEVIPKVFQVGLALECFLKFEVEHGGKKVPLPDGIVVEAWDHDSWSPNDKIGSARVYGNGCVHIATTDKDEDNPDIFFIVKGGNRKVNNVKIPNDWSTKRFDRHSSKTLGSRSSPETFTIT